MDFKKSAPSHFADAGTMNKDEAQQEIESLREAVEYHNYLYYVKNRPRISDAEYDRLFARLQELEDAFPELQSEVSPTRRVGAQPADELKKVDHTAPMLSLNAAAEEEGIKDFDSFIRRNIQTRPVYVAEPKFDGLSIEVVFRDGVYDHGATRGDGQTGEDISDNLKTVKTVPLYLQKSGDVPAFLSVRGEVYMPRSAFYDLNQRRIESGREPFANPRNAAAGIVRQLDPRQVVDKPLDVFFYEIIAVEGYQLSDHWRTLRQLAAWGLKTNRQLKKCNSFDEIRSYYNEISAQRDSFDYEIDGIVIKLNDYAQREQLGTRHRSPRWAMAWKFPPKTEVTRLDRIAVQVGRTGMLTPVAVLEPVDVGGVTVSRATLHNEDEVKRKDVRAGDTVRIIRAGDVIPEVAERVEQQGAQRGKAFSMPGRCPSCGARVFREGAYYFCPAGLSCPAQIVGRIIHYCSRPAMDITGLGDKTVKQLADAGMVQDMADLYRLETGDFLKLEGFAQKSAEQLYSAIQNRKRPSLDRFVFALGIRHIGERAARVLAGHFKTFEALRSAAEGDLEAIPEIGPEMARSVTRFFADDKNRDVLKRLERYGVAPQAVQEQKQKTPLEGCTFVFTGDLASYTRTEAQQLVERLGGRAASSVSSNTDYVVVGDNPGKKRDEAGRLQIPILDEKGFKQMVGR